MKGLTLDELRPVNASDLEDGAIALPLSRNHETLGPVLITTNRPTGRVYSLRLDGESAFKAYVLDNNETTLRLALPDVIRVVLPERTGGHVGLPGTLMLTDRGPCIIGSLFEGMQAYCAFFLKDGKVLQTDSREWREDIKVSAMFDAWSIVMTDGFGSAGLARREATPA